MYVLASVCRVVLERRTGLALDQDQDTGEEQEMASTRGKSLWEKLAKSKLKNNKLLLTVEQQLMIH